MKPWCVPGPFIAQTHWDGITFNQITEFFFSNPLLWKCSLESEFQTAFHLNAPLNRFCRVRVKCLSWMRPVGFSSLFHYCMASEEQKNLGIKASSRLKTIMNWSQWTVSSQAPEKRVGRDCPIPDKDYGSVWFSNTSPFGVPTLQGRNLCDHSQSSYSALHTPHKGFSYISCCMAQGKAAQWGLICPVLPCLIHCFMQVVVELFLIHPATLLLEVTLIIHVGWIFFFL